MGLQSTVVLDQGASIGPAFGAHGTPMAILIDAEGNVASRIAIGASNVLALGRNAAPLEKRNGIKLSAV
jgi:hypothetical protein